MYIYCIKNTINNKRYIGRTKHLPGRRRIQHFGLLKKTKHPNKYLQAAFNKYGEDVWAFEILESSLNITNILKAEKYFVEVNKSNQAAFGYNLTVGGDGILGFKHSVAAKEKIGIASKVRGGVKIGGLKLIGRKKPIEIVEKIRSANLGKKRSKDIIEKIRLKKIGVSNTSLKKPVRCSNGVCFDSIREAALAISAKPDSITEVLKGRRKSIYGLTFSYIESVGG